MPLLSSFLLAILAAGPVPRPHIIFILADDLGPGDIACCGGKTPTPNLDRLASQGIRFTQFYSAAPICSPSRCGLLTGQYPGKWKITSFLQTRAGNRDCGQADYLDAKAPALPRALQAAGYATAHFGKWHLGGGRDVVEPPKFSSYGYDRHAGTWESPEPHPDITATNWIWSPQDRFKRWERTGFFVDQTLDFIKANRSKPCFVNLWLDDPHTPWVPDVAAQDQKKKDTQSKLAGVMTEVDRQIGRLV
ncbi:MAG TPA: sulfatase-like hydrolase/transferase, partial [Planctomycetia bacterium]|nr:sulfatase-like hydrolase/transferase [Planctomycetia bacterium]